MQGASDPNASFISRGLGWIGGFASFLPMLADSGVSAIYNAPNNAGLTGQAVAKFNLTPDFDGKVIAGLEATSFGADAFTGFGEMLVPLSTLTPKNIIGNFSRAELKLVDGLVELDPKLIKTTQTTTKQQGATLKALTNSMKENGFVVEPDKLIDVVRMQDGSLTSLDNTRIAAADLAGVKVKARVSNFDDLLPDDADFVSRFVGRNGEIPKTFGEAVENRVSNQKKVFRETYPLGSPFISLGKNY